jgi:hypothetical protein
LHACLVISFVFRRDLVPNSSPGSRQETTSLKSVKISVFLRAPGELFRKKPPDTCPDKSPSPCFQSYFCLNNARQPQATITRTTSTTGEDGVGTGVAVGVAGVGVAGIGVGVGVAGVGVGGICVGVAVAFAGKGVAAAGV